MPKRVNVNDMTQEIKRQLGAYSDEITDEIKQAVDDVTKQAFNEIKNHITFKDHNVYSKAMSTRTLSESQFGKKNVWYVKEPHYRLTHLLEKGHRKRNGEDSTNAYPHIIYGEELIERELPKKVEEILNNAN